jgi:3-mercaptopyruvate sulfurtransferase SseA
VKLEFDQKGISRTSKIIIYGDNQEQASNAAATLFDLNYLNAYVLEGGLDAWKAAGGQLE